MTTDDLIGTIGSRGSNDGELYHPTSAVVSNGDNAIISDHHDQIVSELCLDSK